MQDGGFCWPAHGDHGRGLVGLDELDRDRVDCGDLAMAMKVLGLWGNPDDWHWVRRPLEDAQAEVATPDLPPTTRRWRDLSRMLPKFAMPFEPSRRRLPRWVGRMAAVSLPWRRPRTCRVSVDLRQRHTATHRLSCRNILTGSTLTPTCVPRSSQGRTAPKAQSSKGGRPICAHIQREAVLR
jgi:hypothetical protein